MALNYKGRRNTATIPDISVAIQKIKNKFAKNTFHFYYGNDIETPLDNRVPPAARRSPSVAPRIPSIPA